MKSSLKIVVLLSFTSCSAPEHPAAKPGIPNAPPVTRQLVEDIIRHDSLALSLPGRRGKPILTQLIPLELVVKFDPHTYSHTTVLLGSLLHLQYSGGFFFTSHDSLALVQQAQQPLAARLDTTRLAPRDWLTPPVLKRLQQQKREPAFYRFSQPLFSRDSSRAYLLLDYYCAGCGGGIAILAERKKGEWQLVDKRVRWKN